MGSEPPQHMCLLKTAPK
ncbi:hypothetical protein LINGRAHAP2_LOCUS10740 [Linum grandiflorum]